MMKTVIGCFLIGLAAHMLASLIVELFLRHPDKPAAAEPDLVDAQIWQVLHEAREITREAAHGLG